MVETTEGSRIPRCESLSPEAEALRADAIEYGTPNRDLYYILDRVPDLMTTFHEHWRAIFDNGVVDRDLKELVRRKIANYLECATCKQVAVPGETVSIEDKLLESYAWRESTQLTDREKGAMWLLDHLMDRDKDVDEMYRYLRSHFSDAEITELGWFAGLNMGTIPFIRSWNLHEHA